jgi:hypothetical protein
VAKEDLHIELTIAAQMRQALDQADWSLQDDPEEAIAVLLTLSSAIGRLTTDDTDPQDLTAAKTIFECKTLADVYFFTALVQKSVDQRHPAQPPGRSDQPRAQFIAQVTGAFPELLRRQQEVSLALRHAFPPESASS